MPSTGFSPGRCTFSHFTPLSAHIFSATLNAFSASSFFDASAASNALFAFSPSVSDQISESG